MRWVDVALLVLLLSLTAAARTQKTSPSTGQPPPASPPSTGPADTPQASPEKPEKKGSQPETGEIVVWNQLAKGDHVNLLMKSGQHFEGHVVALTPKAVTLDFTFSRQNVTGVVTFPKAEVAVVMRLPQLTKEEREARLERRRRRVREARQRWSAVISSELAGKSETARLTPEQEEERRRAEEERQVERYRALLREFPPEEGWGPERLAQIRRRHFILGLPVTYPEWRFWQVFDQWSEAKTIVELYEQRRRQEQQMLLTLFPPEEGWGPAVKKQLEEKKKAGEKLTKLEARFLKDYDRWEEAVSAQAEARKEKPPTTPTAPSPAPTP